MGSEGVSYIDDCPEKVGAKIRPIRARVGASVGLTPEGAHPALIQSHVYHVI